MAVAAPRPCCHRGCSKYATHRGYCEEHKKDATGWYRTSREKTTERGLGWQWQLRREEVLRRDNGLCQECLRKGVLSAAREVDHIDGDRSDLSDENLQSLCRACHAEKTAAQRNSRGG